MLVLTHFLLNIFSFITCVYQKKSVKTTWSWWTALCPRELLPWWLCESSWWVRLIGHKSMLHAMNHFPHVFFIHVCVFSFPGPWRSGEQDPARVLTNGRDGSPFGGVRIPTGQNHHHSCRQESQRPLPHHTWHWWVMLKWRYAVIALYLPSFPALSILDVNYISV